MNKKNKQKMKRAVSMLLILMMLGGVGACGKDAGDGDLKVTAGTPTYEDDKQLEMAAYCGPRRSGYRYWNGTYGNHPEDPEDGWEGWITKEDFQDYMDCGFTYLMSELDAPYDYNFSINSETDSFEGSDLKAYMDLAEEMQIPVVVYSNRLIQLSSSTDSRISEEDKAFITQMINDLSQYKMFKGFSLRDEPNIEHAKAFGALYDFILDLKPDAHFFTSYLPIYCSDLTRLTTTNFDDYEKAYMDYVNAFSDATGSFAYDSYPLWEDPVQGTTSIEKTWFQNLNMVAENGKEKGYSPSITIQSCAFGTAGEEYSSSHKRATTQKDDITFQLYTALAYGYKEINYFTYWEHWSSSETEEFYTAMINYPESADGEPVKTDAYYAVKEANAEIKKFDHVIMNFDWEGTFALTGEGKSMSMGLQLAGNYESPRIASATATDEAIIGCLKDADGYDGYMIVNATDPGKDLSNSVTVTFKKATKAIAYIKGEETEITLKDGSYTFDLESGAGVFVIPIQ